MKRLILPALVGLVLAGCSQAREPESASVAASGTAAATGPAAPAATEPATSRPAHVIYHGELELAVDDFEKAAARIDQLCDKHHAYLSTAYETRTGGQHRQEMNLKVEPAGFLPLVAALGQLGRIDNKEVTSADVTADLMAATRQAAEATYAQQLAHAATPAEARRLEEQVRQARLALAASQARAQQLGGQSQWATLTLRFGQVLPEAGQTEPLPSFLVAFQRGWAGVVVVAVLLTNSWPLLVLGTLAAGAGRWWLRRQAVAALI